MGLSWPDIAEAAHLGHRRDQHQAATWPIKAAYHMLRLEDSAGEHAAMLKGHQEGAPPYLLGLEETVPGAPSHAAEPG
jgi:hypothetical protein